MKEDSRLEPTQGLLQRLLGALAGSAGVRFVGIGLTFLVGVQLARALGPEGYGIYGSVMAIIAITAVPAQIGLPPLLTREVATPRDTAGLGALKTFLLVAAAGVAAVATLEVVVLGGLTVWSSELFGGAGDSLWWGLPLVPFLALTALALGAIRGLNYVVWAQVYDALIRPMLFAGSLLVLGARLDVHWALALHGAAAAVTLMLAFGHLLRILPERLRRAPFAPFDGRLARGAGAFAGTEVLRVVDGQYAILVLGILGTMEEVGMFRVGLSLAGFVALPYALVNAVIMPYLARFHTHGDHDRLRLLCSGSVLVMVSTTALGVFALGLLGENGIAWLLGEDFRRSWFLMMAISGAFFVRTLVGPAAMVLYMCGAESRVPSGYGLGLVVGAMAMWLSEPSLGPVSGALGLALAEITRGLWWWYCARTQLGVDVSLFSAPIALRHLSRSQNSV